MNDLIYTPPKADIEVHDHADGDYYVVAPTKFLVLTILTLQLYLVYWFYRQWRSVKQREESSIWPIPRGFFYIFFTHSLFSDIDGTLTARGDQHKWSAGATATLVVLTTLASSILSRLVNNGVGEPITDIISLAIVPLLAFFVLPAQKAANVASGDPTGSRNASLTVANWAWIILGGIFWGLALLGLYVIMTVGSGY